MQVKQGQNLRDLRRAAHVRWQYHALEAPSLAVLVHPLVVDPRGTDIHCPSSQEDLTFGGAPIANDQGVTIFLALVFGRFDVGIDLRLQCLGEHLPRSLAGDLVEIEREHFACVLVLVYPAHAGVSFPPTLQRRLCQLTRWEGTPRASRNLQSTTFEHISSAW